MIKQTNTAENSNPHEIEISEISRCIWTQRITVILCITIGFFAALVYVTLAIPLYETNTSIKPVTVADLDELNGSGLYKLSPLESLKSIGAAMESYESRLKFFTSHPRYLASSPPSGKSIEKPLKNSTQTVHSH